MGSALKRLQELGSQHLTELNLLGATAREIFPKKLPTENLHIFVQRLPGSQFGSFFRMRMTLTS